ncbi:MAG: hypothetical protein IJ689_01880 [Alphaproteobacteria bacterium]|nr:hypothetical protein [Alphaproteobacteria bacterium]
MKNYILLLGVATVALGSYCAYAGNSATMTVTATIAHDVSLTVTHDLELGTITINPAYTGNDTYWTYSTSGIISYTSGKALVSAPNATIGTFTANVPDPSNHGNIFDYTAEMSLGGKNYCSFGVFHISGNTFVIYPDECGIEDMSALTAGTYSVPINISYIPS